MKSIKFDIELTDVLFNKLTKIHHHCKNNTCGPKSISKQELIKEFNKVICGYSPGFVFK